MTERPILMSAPMVRALLAGRKTQTRRVVKSDALREAQAVKSAGHLTLQRACPYGAPGDRLWVRETWRTEELADGTDGVRFPDGAFCACENTPEVGDAWGSQHSAKSARRGTVWRPSIHMPRWASRITLEVTGVRVERLQDISEEDALAEGADCPAYNQYPEDCPCWRDDAAGYRWHFRSLWESINGTDSWASNPWVWVVSLKRVTP